MRKNKSIFQSNGLNDAWRGYISPCVKGISVRNSLPLATSPGVNNSFERPLEDNKGEDFQW